MTDRQGAARHEIEPGGCHGELSERDIRLDHRDRWLALETVRGAAGVAAILGVDAVA